MPATITATPPTSDTEKKRPKQGRSPAYPALNLEEAIGQAKALYEKEGKYSVPMPSAFAAWGYGAKSSGGREVRASLKYFGLITVEGDRDTGKVKLTDKALRVLLDEREDQTEKRSLIRELALNPTIHKRLFEKFPEGIKSVPTAEHFLVFDEQYNKSVAGEVVAEFKATADYAGLYQPANVSGIKSEKPDDQPKARPEIGDLVQAEIGGNLALEKPERVRAIQDGWVFVENYEAAVPMEQVQVIEKAGVTPPAPDVKVGLIDPPRLPLTRTSDALPPEWREERLLDETGEEIFVRYKGEPSKERYEFIRDYLDFKLKRMK